MKYNLLYITTTSCRHFFYIVKSSLHNLIYEGRNIIDNRDSGSVCNDNDSSEEDSIGSDSTVVVYVAVIVCYSTTKLKYVLICRCSDDHGGDINNMVVTEAASLIRGSELVIVGRRASWEA